MNLFCTGKWQANSAERIDVNQEMTNSTSFAKKTFSASSLSSSFLISLSRLRLIDGAALERNGAMHMTVTHTLSVQCKKEIRGLRLWLEMEFVEFRQLRIFHQMHIRCAQQDGY